MTSFMQRLAKYFVVIKAACKAARQKKQEIETEERLAKFLVVLKAVRQIKSLGESERRRADERHASLIGMAQTVRELWARD